MSRDTEIQFIEKLKSRKFCSAADGAADGAHVIMDKKNGCLNLLKDENPDMLFVHCVIHRENLVAKNISPELNTILKSVMKCINAIKANAKCERLFKQFCEDNNADHVRLLLHTEVRWLSKGNCLKRFIKLFDELSDFLSDKTEIKHLLTIDGKAFLNYLTDIFEKLNVLIKQLQGTNKTLVDAKAKIFGFISFIELCQKHISRCERKNYGMSSKKHSNRKLKPDFSINEPSFNERSLLMEITNLITD